MRKLTVDLKERSYDIIIQNGILKDVKNYIDDENKKVFLISNHTVYEKFGKYFEGYEPILIGDGEQYKNFDTYKILCEKLLSMGIQRTDLIIALGGGVVGDLAGFVASTCLRGVDLIQIPTTLLSQVDSSVGGKTAIDTVFGKNLIGTFYQPKRVLIDPDTLKELPERQIKTGLAEVLKYAFIEKNILDTKDEDLFFNFLSNCKLEDSFEEIIYKCCLMKARVVEKDEREGGLRAILNFGHTFAHAIEKVSNYTVYTHGEAVAMGMNYVLKLALLKGYITKEYYEKSIQFLSKYGLDLVLDKRYNPESIIKSLQSDKKVKYGKLNFVMPTDFALVQTVQNIDEPSLKESLL